jgi:hypothetical protein
MITTVNSQKNFLNYIKLNVVSLWDEGILDTTVSEEKRFNPRLTKSKEEFVEIMKNLNLAYPAQIGINNSYKFIIHNNYPSFI